MSSCIYLTFKSPVTIDVWMKFCNENEIIFSPNTVGQNVFYSDQVQITLHGFGKLPILENGSYDFDKATPPDQFTEAVFSSYQGRNLSDIADLFKKANEYFTDLSISCDGELNYYVMYKHLEMQEEIIIINSKNNGLGFVSNNKINFDPRTKRFCYETFENLYAINKMEKGVDLLSSSYRPEVLRKFNSVNNLLKHVSDICQGKHVVYIDLGDSDYFGDTYLLSILNNDSDNEDVVVSSKSLNEISIYFEENDSVSIYNVLSIIKSNNDFNFNLICG
jgi:hypothetical protein